nr:hypothetical protein CWKEJDCK_CWKEJDCK_CDS_0004 [Microvirus sp.]
MPPRNIMVPRFIFLPTAAVLRNTLTSVPTGSLRRIIKNHLTITIN